MWFYLSILESKWKKSGFKQNENYLKETISVMNKELEFYILFIKVPENNSEEYHFEFSNNNEEFLKALNLITG